MPPDPIAQAGIVRNDDGSLSDHHIEWITFEYRNFGELLAAWSDLDVLIGELGLSQDDLVAMISGHKAASRGLVNFLCAVVPRQLCSWLVLRNRGYWAARTIRDEVTLPAESLAVVRLQELVSLAKTTVAPNSNDDSSAVFLEFVSEKIDEMARRFSRTADPVGSMANLAAVLGVSVAEFRGEIKLDSDIAEKSTELARFLNLESDDFDQCVELAASAWSGISAGRSNHAFPRMMKFLRHTQGLNQKEFSTALGLNDRLICQLEQAIGWPTNDFVARVSALLHLADKETAILERASAEYSTVLDVDVSRHLEPVVTHFCKYGLTAEKTLQASRQYPWLFYKKPETVIANIEGVVEYGAFKEAGLLCKDYLQAAIKRPSLFAQKPETVIGHIERVAGYGPFKEAGLLRKDYLQAAIKWPSLFARKPETLIANIEGVVGYGPFKEAGLLRKDYLQAAIKWPSLFARKPETLIANIEGVVGYGPFKEAGLLRKDYLQAVIKTPSLFSQKAQRLIANIEEVAEYSPFKDAGLLRKDYLQAAVKRPWLFSQKPETVIANIEGVVEYGPFKGAGFLRKDYLRAAIRQPSLFSQKPETLIGRINRVIAMYERGRLTVYKHHYNNKDVKPLKPLFDLLTRNPKLLCLSHDNFTLREIYAAVTDATSSAEILNRSRSSIEQTLFGKYGHSDRDARVPLAHYDPSIEEGSAAAKEVGDTLMLRALIRGGILGGSLEEPKAQRKGGIGT
jgi:transcriptional regulator with XRE-family HTH domain